VNIEEQTFSEVQLSLVQHGEMGDERSRRLPLPPGEELHLRDKFLIRELTNQRKNGGIHGLCITQ